MTSNKSTEIAGQNILVTGGTGSIGSAVVERLLQLRADKVRIITNDENSLATMSEQVKDHRLSFRLGDIRDRATMIRATEGIDGVVHAAALKHVPFCEMNPAEAAAVNIVGTQQTLDASRSNGVEWFCMISTDKAVNPSNAMGASKLLAEKVSLQDANRLDASSPRVWVTRFGNVWNSRGSVIPVWLQRAKAGRPIQVTHPDMTRFVISMDDAADFITRGVSHCTDGEIVVPGNMPALRIGDLMDAFQTIYPSVDVEQVGIRPGEKMHEALFSDAEIPHVEDDGWALSCRFESPKGPESTPDFLCDSSQAPRLSVEELGKRIERLVPVH